MALYRLSRSIIHLTLLLLLPWRIIKYEYENSPSAWCLRGRGMALKGRGEGGRGAVCKHVQERNGNVNAHNDEPMEPSDVNALLPPLGDRPLGLHIWSSDIDRRSSLQETRNRSRSSEKNHSGALLLVLQEGREETDCASPHHPLPRAADSPSQWLWPSAPDSRMNISFLRSSESKCWIFLLQNHCIPVHLICTMKWWGCDASSVWQLRFNCSERL